MNTSDYAWGWTTPGWPDPVPSTDAGASVATPCCLWMVFPGPSDRDIVDDDCVENCQIRLSRLVCSGQYLVVQGFGLLAGEL